MKLHKRWKRTSSMGIRKSIYLIDVDCLGLGYDTYGNLVKAWRRGIDYNNMKYLLLALAAAVASSNLIITDATPVVAPAPSPSVNTDLTAPPTPSILPKPQPEFRSESENVVIGKVIPTTKEYYSIQTSEGFNTQTPAHPPNRKHQKSKDGHKNHNQLRGVDQSMPNYYPYQPADSYHYQNEYEFEDEDFIATFFGIFFGVVVFIAVVAACKRRAAVRRARSAQRNMMRMNRVQGGNVIENINSQIRYHEQESNRLRTALLEEQQNAQRRLQPQPQYHPHHQPQPQPQNYSPYPRYHQLPPPILPARHLNETQQAFAREYPEESRVVYPNFNYPSPPAQVPYRPFRNEEELSVIHKNNVAQSETFSDYPRL